MYQQTYTVLDAHIDFQDVVANYYYLYYLQKCRHQFAIDVLGFDFVQKSKEGMNLVVAECKVRYKRALLRNDQFVVTCSCHPSAKGKPAVYFKQQILKDDKLMVEAVFKVACVPNEGRPRVPDFIADAIKGNVPYPD